MIRFYRPTSCLASNAGRAGLSLLGRRYLSTFRQLMNSNASQPHNKTPPLEGIKILDMTRVLAGPYCSMILADLGADVVKVERPGTGDDTRAWGPPYATGGESAYYLCVNRNKRSIAVDFSKPEGAGLLRRMATEWADVVIENYLPGTLDRKGLGYEDLCKDNPGLIYCSITGYGQTGPMRDRAGYDVVVEAEAGLMSITGAHDGEPAKVGVAITDLTTGLYAHGAIMAALLHRAKNGGQGQHIDCCLIDCQVASLANVASSYLIGGMEGERWGTAHSSVVPYQSFHTKDGRMLIGAGNDRQFRLFCQELGRPELGDDPRFLTNADRVTNRDVLLPIIEEAMQERPTAEWLVRFRKINIPNGPINGIAGTFDHEQVKARGMVQTVDHPTAGSIKVVGVPVKYSKAEANVRTAPPLLGQHTDEVLVQDLGFDDDKMAELRKSGAIPYAGNAGME
eukprot:Clim_evm105s108 gene=Clim_evmTU105s108